MKNIVMISKSIFLFIWLILSIQSCRCININTTNRPNKTLIQETHSFNKKWLEKNFNTKNILKIDSEYDGTLFIVMFKKIHRDDAEALLSAFKEISEDVHMIETTSFYQIYLSKKTVEKICRLSHK